MNLRQLLSTVTVLILLACIEAQTTVVSGSTLDCIGQKRSHPRGVDIFIFDAAKCQELAKLLSAISVGGEPNPDDIDSVEAFFARYNKLMSAVKASKRLASTKSNSSGIFRISVTNPPANLIVLAYAESIDGPPLYAYRELHEASKATVPIILDFTHGHCAQ